MKKQLVYMLGIALLFAYNATPAFALGETGKTVTYQVVHDTAAGKLTTYTHYSIIAHEETGYWLQRTTSMTPDGELLSITQTLLDDYTHEPLRYIMHRPEQMNRPPNIIDLPLEKMGQDEILPTPITGTLSEPFSLRLNAGVFEVQKGQRGDVMFWLSLDIPVLGVAKVETPEWTMELVRITDQAVDLLPQKPPKGGIVYLKKK